MASETDITLRPVLSTDGIKSSARNLRKEIDNIFKASEGKEMNNQMQSLQTKMSKLAGQSREVAKEMEKLANTKIPTKEYEQAQQRVDNIAKALEKADEKWQELEAVGAKQQSIQQWIDKANYFEEKLQKAKQRVQEIEDAGRAFTFGTGTEEMRKLEESQKNLYNDMAVTVNKAYELDPALKRSVQEMNGLNQATSGSKKLLDTMKGGLRTVATHTKNAAGHLKEMAGTAVRKGIEKLKNSLLGVGKASKGTGLTFKKILMYGFGIRSLYVLFNRLRNAIKEGVNNLAQFNGGSNSVNKALSSITSALAQMKNAWGSAFGPIITLVAPALTTLINLCTKAATAIGMLVAKLSGATTFTRATKINKDYAKSLGGVGGAASKAADKLAAFDDLNVLGDDKNSGGGGGGVDPNSMFETVPIDEKIAGWADAMSKFFEPFQKAWDDYGQTVMDKWTYGLTSVKELAVSIGDSFLQVWTNGSGEKFLDHILITVADIGEIVGNLATNFRQAWETNDVGTQIFQDVFNILNLIAGSIQTCADETARWSANLDFYPLLSSFESLLSSINTLLTPIMNMLTTLYTTVILPMTTWLIESLIPALNTLVADVLTLIGETLAELQPVLDWFMQNVIIPIGAEIGQQVINILNTIGAVVSGPLSNSIHKLIEYFVSYVWPWLQKLLQFLKVVLIGAIKVLGAVIELFFEDFAVIVDSIVEVLGGLWKFIKGVFTGNWSEAWEGVKQIFKGVFNGIVSIAENAVNKIIDLLNTLNFDVPDWVPGIGGSHFGFNLQHISIPRLAQGAVIPPNREFLAVLGDQNQGTNIEAPLETIKEAFADVVANMEVQNTGYSEMTLDGETFARLIVPYVVSELNREGYNVSVLES